MLLRMSSVEIYYLFQVLIGLALGFHFPIYALFLERHGLGAEERNQVNAVFMATIAIFEIPTGIIADVWGRKLSCIASFMLMSLTSLIYFQATSIREFLIAEIIGGIAITLSSGAFQAWLEKEMEREEERGVNLQSALSHGHVVTNIARCVGALVGAYVGSLDISWPWLLMAVAYFAIGILAMFSMREKWRKRASIPKSARHSISILRVSLRHLRRTRVLWFVFAQAGLIVLGTYTINMQWPMFCQLGGMRQVALGVTTACWTILLAIGAYGVRNAVPKNAKNRVLQSILLRAQVYVGTVIVIAGMGISCPSLGITAFLLHEIGRGMLEPLFNPESRRSRDRIFDECIVSNAAGIAYYRPSALFALHTS